MKTKTIPVPRSSPLDSVHLSWRSNDDLFEKDGTLSVRKAAKMFGMTKKELLPKDMDAESRQNLLVFLEKILRLRRVFRVDANRSFAKWMKTKNNRLGLVVPKPVDLAKVGKWQALADLVDDILTGSPA